MPLLVLQWLFTEWHISPWLDKKMMSNLRRFENKLTRAKEKRKLWVKYLLITLCLLLLLVAGFIFVGYLYKSATLLVGFPVATVLVSTYLNATCKKWTHGQDDEQMSFHRFGRIIMLLSLLPFIGYDYGKFKAEAILKGNEYSYIMSGKDKKYKFIGFANGHFFFLDAENQVLLLNNGVEKIQIFRFLKKGEKDRNDIGYT